MSDSELSMAEYLAKYADKSLSTKAMLADLLDGLQGTVELFKSVEDQSVRESVNAVIQIYNDTRQLLIDSIPEITKLD